MGWSACLALLDTIGSGLATALKSVPHREAALITSLATLSWRRRGFLARGGRSIALFVQQYARRPDARLS